MVVVDSQESSAASTGSKFQGEKLTEFFLLGFWCGPCRRMPYEFAAVRSKYPNTPAEKVDMAMFHGEGLMTKLFRALNIDICSVIIKTDFKDREVVKRTILVRGGDAKKLEAAAERLNKQQQ